LGNSLAAESKLQFYPTQEIETYRLLTLLGDLQLDYIKERYIRDYTIISKEEYNELFLKSADANIPIRFVIFDKWLKEERYDLIKSYFTIRFGSDNYNNRKENFPITICDPFCGEGEFLDVFKSFIPKDKYSGDIFLIGNELESNRYERFKDNININEKYNKSFEELNLLKNSLSLILFNCPYGSTNGIRNVKNYINQILEKKLIYNPQNSKDYKTGYMVFVIRKDDFLDSLDVICQYFNVFKNAIYKVNVEEYAKFKQYIFIARLNNRPYDLNNITDAMDYKNNYNDIKRIIESEPEFELSMYNTYQMMNYPYIDYKTLKENHQYVEVSNNYISKNDSVWNWVKDITELKNLGEEKLTVPKPLKLGEIANILASGMINGEIDLDGKGKHVVIGGTKSIQKKEVNTYKDDNGEKITETKIIKMSLPYLNILCSENGELKIKELGEIE